MMRTVGCSLAGMSLSLWSFVAPHGALDLPAIFIAGGAGFKIANGLLFPGMLPRRDSLAAAGREATSLVLGIVPMLIIAGTIEAFVSPTGLPGVLKFAMSAALFTLLNVYLFGAEREEVAKESRASAAAASRP